MPDTINITVNEAIDNVVINPAITTDVIDINTYSTAETINIDVTPEVTIVNINTVTGGGGTLNELDNVLIVSETNNQALVYESSTDLWKNKTVDKTFVGLANVDNTSDANKPVSSAQSTAIALKEDSTNKSNDIADSPSTTKFPVWSAILAYFTASRIRTILGYTPPRTFFSGADGTTVTNTTTITATYSQLIPANTFVAGDVIDLLFRAISTVAKVSPSNLYVYVNTANSTTSPAPLQIAIFTATQRTMQMTRTLAIKGATTRVTTSTGSANADTSLTGASSLLTINWAVDQYFIFAIGHSVALSTETLTGDCFRILKS